jgi:hypothetical protein
MKIGILYRPLIYMMLAVVLVQIAAGVPDEAVGRVLNVISGDSIGIEIQISDPRTRNIDGIKLADIKAPSTISPEGKKAQKYAESLLKNKTVCIDIDENSTGGRNRWNELVCVVYLIDEEYRPVWPPVNRILVDAGYAELSDDKSNEFNASAWWDKPGQIGGSRAKLLMSMAQKENDMSGVAAQRDSSQTSVLKREGSSGRISIGYRS